jgi:ABC-type Fe2+-enterobactin transport system substrate-binding protein
MLLGQPATAVATEDMMLIAISTTGAATTNKTMFTGPQPLLLLELRMSSWQQLSQPRS